MSAQDRHFDRQNFVGSQRGCQQIDEEISGVDLPAAAGSTDMDYAAQGHHHRR
jgi:hypothetical protein